MAFKKMDTDIGFADLALASSLKHNRSLKIYPGKPPMKLNVTKKSPKSGILPARGIFKGVSLEFTTTFQ